MDTQTQLKLVDELTSSISEKIGMLVRRGVLSSEEGINFIKDISDKTTEWMQEKFTSDEINIFMEDKLKNKPIGDNNDERETSGNS